MEMKAYNMETGKFNEEYFNTSFKQVSIYINDSQKRGLQEYLDSINFQRYVILKDVESSWSGKLKHMNSHVWPGSDSMFIMSVREDELHELLTKLKKYRMTLSENIIFAVGIVPIDRIIPDLYNFEV